MIAQYGLLPVGIYHKCSVDSSICMRRIDRISLFYIVHKQYVVCKQRTRTPTISVHTVRTD